LVGDIVAGDKSDETIFVENLPPFARVSVLFQIYEVVLLLETQGFRVCCLEVVQCTKQFYKRKKEFLLNKYKIPSPYPYLKKIRHQPAKIMNFMSPDPRLLSIFTQFHRKVLVVF